MHPPSRRSGDEAPNAATRESHDNEHVSRVQRTLASDVGAPAAVRRMVAEVAAELPFELIERATLAVSELVTNAVRHGSTTGATITVVATARPQQLTIDVVDMGTGKPAAQSGAGGFGLGIVSQVAESVVIEESDSWRVVVEFTPR